jgi:hypothetical protein
VRRRAPRSRVAASRVVLIGHTPGRGASSCEKAHAEEGTVLLLPNPTELSTLVDDRTVTRHRSLFCPCYDECLDRAADSGWKSFTCEHCALYLRRHEMTLLYARANYHPAEETEIAVAV